jgi:predicted phage tail protein
MLAIDASGAVYVTGKGGPNPGSGTISYVKGVVAKYNSNGTPQWAVWDDYAGGMAIRLGAGNTIATLGWGYLVTTHYTQTGLPDLVPDAPTNLSGFVSSNGSSYDAILSFSDNANNEFWVEAERCTGSGCTNFTKVAQSLGENATGLIDTNLERGVTYTYRVVALGFMGLSGPSNSAEIVVPPATPPAAPSNLTTAMNGANVVLNWQDNSTNESLFQIERCQGTGCTGFAWLDASAAGITTLMDYNAAAGQSFSYRVSAWNFDGYSSYSNIATIITPGGPSLPATPSGLTAMALNKSQIDLHWTDNSSNETGFRIEQSLNGVDGWVEVGTSGPDVSIFSNLGLSAGTDYYYRVRAYVTDGNSDYSNTAYAKSSLGFWLPYVGK